MEDQKAFKLIAKAIPDLPRRFKEIEGKLRYAFADKSLLLEALTHSSLARELNQGEDIVCWNERLEFLGDAVLGLVISETLMKRTEQFSEGELSKLRAALVKEGTLSDLALDFGLQDALLLGINERQHPIKRSILADAFEALIGAFYLDAGLKKTAHFIKSVYSIQKLESLTELLKDDSKSQLQEWTQKHYRDRPEYHVIGRKGPEHLPEFEVEVKFRSLIHARGIGTTKKKASQNAAQNALARLKAPHDERKDEEAL